MGRRGTLARRHAARTATAGSGATQAMASNTPPPWMDPAHMLTTPAPSAPMVRKIDEARRAHSMMVTPEGNMHPIILNGYLADPTIPWQYMTELTGGPLRAAVRTDWGAKDPVLSVFDVHSAADDSQPFNPFGSLLASDVGFTLEPLYGRVFFTRVIGDGRVVNKLSMESKELLTFKMIGFHSVSEGVRPDFMTDDQYLLAGRKIMTVVALAGLAHDTAPAGQ